MPPASALDRLAGGVEPVVLRCLAQSLVCFGVNCHHGRQALDTPDWKQIPSSL